MYLYIAVVSIVVPDLLMTKKCALFSSTFSSSALIAIGSVLSKKCIFLLKSFVFFKVLYIALSPSELPPIPIITKCSIFVFFKLKSFLYSSR